MFSFFSRLSRLAVVCLALMVVPLVALAQADVLNADDLDSIADALAAALTSGNWSLVVMLVVVALIWAARRYGAAYVPWLGTRFGGLVLALAGAAAVGIATALLGGSPLTLALVLGVLLKLIGTHSLLKNAGQVIGVVPPKKADTLAEATAVLERAAGKGPKP